MSKFTNAFVLYYCITPFNRLEKGTAYASAIREKAERHAIAILKGDADPIIFESNDPTELPDNLTDLEISSQSGEKQAFKPMQGPNGQDFVQFNYKQDSTARPLPIENRRKEIIDTIRSRRVTIIEGHTGCGKTTQVPLFVAQDCSSRGEKVNIVVTQPRRIAAISVARHVAQLCNSQLGEYVGYQIALDRHHSGRNTNILFCTTGVLLQKIIHTKSLSYYTHIMIDEVHERDVETDFLLMVVRKLMWEQNPNVKLVLMSASFESERVAEYFTINYPDPALLPLTKPKVVKVDGAPAKLQTFYLDLLNPVLTPSSFQFPAQELFKKSEPKLLPQLYDVCDTVIDLLDVQETHRREAHCGAVLVFLPGLNEINQMKQKIEARPNSSKFQVLVLHSCINDTEQHKIFEKAKSGVRKIILATNIAESSITVPDISYVIDFCLTKQLVVDPVSNLPTLKLQWATMANLTQRAGRAGRVRDGRVYRLIYSTFVSSLSLYPIPEICRSPLDLAVLRTKILDLGPPKELLAFCLDPPVLEGIRAAVLKLKRIGGLTVLMPDGSFNNEDGQLTALGKIMSSLPIDVTLTKLICLGYAFGLLEDCVNIAACLSVQNIFYTDCKKRLDSYKIRFDWSERSFCDLITLSNVLAEFLIFSNSDDLMNDKSTLHNSLEKWANYNMANIRRINEAKTIRDEIFQRLKNIEMYQEEMPNVNLNPSDRDLILRVIIAGAFYPNYFLRKDVDSRLVSKNEVNCYNSVTLSKLPEEGILYAKQIRSLFSTVSTNIDLRFRDFSVDVIFPLNDSSVSHQSRIFLASRGRLEMQNRVASNLREDDFCKSVYVALMMKEFKMPMIINTISDPARIRESMQYFIGLRDHKTAGGLIKSQAFYWSSSKTLLIPPHSPIDYQTSSVDVRIAFIEKCGHFWARVTPDDFDRLRRIRDALSSLDLRPVKPEALYTNMPCIFLSKAQYQEECVPCRAIVRSVLGANSTQIFIRLVDSGESLWTTLDTLREMDLTIIRNNPSLKCILEPAAAIECHLIRVKPLNYSSSGISYSWSKEADSYFKELIEKKDLRLDVYSYVNEVLRVSFLLDVTGPDGKTSREDLSRHLVMKGFAEHAAESCLSEFDHNMRLEERKRMEVYQDSKYFPTRYDEPLRGIDESYFIKSDQGRDERKLAGPTNPLLVSFYGLPKGFQKYPVKIERNSINAVVLEPDPTFSKNRMMVAPSCNLTNGIIIANTSSLMPYIRGFASMMQLLFAPCVELRADEENECYVGALSGLGASPVQAAGSSSYTYHSYDDDCDIQLDFDAFFTMSDFSSIQTIRYLLSHILNDASSSLAKVSFEISGSTLARWQKVLCSDVLSLLSQSRMPLPHHEPRSSSRWVANDPSRLINPANDSRESGDANEKQELKNPFLPTILYIKDILPDLMTIKKKLSQVFDSNENVPRDSETTASKDGSKSCPLCGSSRLYTRSQIKEHLDSYEHKTRMVQFEIHLCHAQKSNTAQQLQVEDEAIESMDA